MNLRMRFPWRWGLLAAAVACAKPDPVSTLPPQLVQRVEQQIAAASQRPEVLGPVHWWHTSGLCLDVPEGWTGEGTDGSTRLLSLVSTNSGVRVEMARQSGGLLDRTGLEPLFEGRASYRDLPALGHVSVQTWIDQTDAGRTLQVWSRGSGPDTLTIEALYPSGWLVRGRQEVDDLLRNLCFEER